MWLELERKIGSRAFINTDRVEAIVQDKEGSALFLLPGEDRWIAAKLPYEEVVAMMTDKTEQNLREMVEALREDVQHVSDLMMPTKPHSVEDDRKVKDWKKWTCCDTPEQAKDRFDAILAEVATLREVNSELRADEDKAFDAGMRHARAEAALSKDIKEVK
jgi:hypothetical protein